MNFPSRRGSSIVEVIFALVVVFLVIAVVMMALPRSRENARLTSCRRNLMLIGQGLAYSDGATGHLPTVPAFGQPGIAPLESMLGQLGLGDLSPLSNPKWKPSGRVLASVPEHVVGDFLCPSDGNARLAKFLAPVSYRANTGGSTSGIGGPFAPGRVITLVDVEKADGQDFTAGFAERLLGSGPGEASDRNDYLLVASPVGEGSEGLPKGGIWQTDAGSSWCKTGWASTLYNHAMIPYAAPSAIARDGRTARMGASSGHTKLVNVLMIGGSVRGFTPSVDPEVWRRFGNVNDPATSTPEP